MTHSILRSILERVPLLQAASVSARDAWSLPLDTVQSPGQPRVMGGALRFAVSAASVTWPSPRPWSTSDYTGQADYTSCQYSGWGGAGAGQAHESPQGRSLQACDASPLKRTPSSRQKR